MKEDGKEYGIEIGAGARKSGQFLSSGIRRRLIVLSQNQNTMLSSPLRMVWQPIQTVHDCGVAYSIQ